MSFFEDRTVTGRRFKKFLAPHYAFIPVFPEIGRGVWVYDNRGDKFLDFQSCYSALNFGHLHPRLVSAAKNQLDKLGAMHLSYCPPIAGELAEKLVNFCAIPNGKVIFQNSGLEAVEASIKLARRFGYKTKRAKPGKAVIVAFGDDRHSNFHGRSTTILSFSTVKEYQKNFDPFTPGFKVVPFGDVDALEQVLDENTVAILIEPIQGEAGVIIPPAGYFQKTRKVCDRFEVIIMLDEVQTGFGRTGYDFAHQHPYLECRPDVLILGKALGGGIGKVAAVVASRNIMDVLGPGSHGSTFGGDPLGCAVAVEALRVMKDEGLSENARHLGYHFTSGLKGIKSPHIKEVRGMGLMIGIEITSQKLAERFCRKLLQEGILCKNSHDVIRISPPLIITKDEINWALPRIEKVLKGG